MAQKLGAQLHAEALRTSRLDISRMDLEKDLKEPIRAFLRFVQVRRQSFSTP